MRNEMSHHCWLIETETELIKTTNIWLKETEQLHEKGLGAITNKMACILLIRGSLERKIDR